MLLFENYLSKASGLFFIFGHVCTGHAHSQNLQIYISWVPTKLTTVFFSCIMTENSTGKAGLEVYGELIAMPVTQFGEETHL